MLRDIKIAFYEPFTGIWVEGVKTLFFNDEADLQKTLKCWEQQLIFRYGDQFSIIVEG